MLSFKKWAEAQRKSNKIVRPGDWDKYKEKASQCIATKEASKSEISIPPLKIKKL